VAFDYQLQRVTLMFSKVPSTWERGRVRVPVRSEAGFARSDLPPEPVQTDP
jgi:hypothetical protein